MPIMNKTGYSMYWNSMWDDKLNYTRSFKEDVFIKIFFNLFVEGGYTFLFRYKIKNIDDHLNFLKKKYNLHIFKKNKEENNFNYITNYSKNSEPYTSKIWLLKYQTWIIFYFFIYSFNSGIFNKIGKKKKIKFKKSNKKYLNILISYYLNLIKLNYNFNLFSKYTLNKFSF
jgi:hypothetical protein